MSESELRHRAAIEGGFDAFFVFDYELDEARGRPGFRLVEMNSRGTAIFGGTAEELVGKFFDDFAPNEERVAYFTEHFRKVYEQGTAFEEEYQVQTDAIEPRWLHYQVVPLVNGVAVTARDITKRRLQEQQLRESERRFLNVVQHVPGVFFTLVPIGGEGRDRMRFGYLSDGIRAITGHDAHEFQGDGRVRFVDLIHPDDRVTLYGSDDLLLSGLGFAIDVRIVHTDGTTRWVHLKAEPNYDADGRGLESASGVMLDVTERKQTEEALRLRQRAVEAMTQGLVIVDATSEDLPIVYVNPAFEELSGYSSEELVGRSPTIFDGPETNPEVVRALLAALETEQSYSGEMITYRKNGTPYWCSLRISPVYDEQGKVTHFISIHTDDTLRRRVEEQFLHTQKMEAVAQLAGGIAHDFNNVLLVIRGYSHVLMSMSGEEGEGWAEAKEIETAATRAADLVSQLLAFSRSQVIQSSVLDVNHIVREAQQQLQPLIGENIKLRLSLDDDIGNVSGDPIQLEQAIVNLSVNALDAMPTGGSLNIRTRNVVVEEGPDGLEQLQPGSYTALSVEDTGLGMDAGTRARVFEPFFSTKGAAKGTGLGLSAVYGMVKQSGGDITVTSAPNEGTSVTIYLPHVGDALATVAEQQLVGRIPPQEETVLLVEDDEKARALVGRVLRESGYSVHEAALPDEALRICDEFEGHIDLLLSDVVMPQMSGPKLAKVVLERRPDTRVMFVSGYIERPDDVDSVSSGADFLQKPFTPAQLLETVRRVLDNEAVTA
jgi:two-component system, cell cycle sensor histidine kinase and response regulator CckA